MKTPKADEDQKEEQRSLGEINARAFPSAPSTQQDLIDRRHQKSNKHPRQTEKAGHKGSERHLDQDGEALKIPSKLVDPCQAARKASHRCLDRNNYDKSLCYDYFEVYRECTKRWVDSKKK
ncbi:hypothetical protein PTTG_10073 [Puccinia triticina 1-1 BBBD Race 1]|uniref:CHCH domain-containing protein n=2 Tax=Puccinia triticina TaxID=208348 RepID=A0A0C4FA32_PUCT1|nr:uncharacterized protein PtA15_2A87 [Puccinia triticina]OAV93961.1 hypothetical protein PTTG_10073 [Puccinia triticina 1-1 BBBD Race 1]WAQ81775.1 hypothetical protein PtA15_2A87 [Puccinia triticina]WAR52661.1 hypothetical protein PtB15_2B85 [Puccinia triticina]